MHVVVAVVHHISWAAVRAGPSKHMGRLMGRAERPYRAHISWAAARPGPSNFERMGRGPTQPITFLIFHGPARPGPPIFSKISTRPARPIIFSKVLARPGRARHNFQIGPARPGPDKRPMTSPEFFPPSFFFLSKCVTFFCLCFVGNQSLFVWPVVLFFQARTLFMVRLRTLPTLPNVTATCFP